MVMTTDVYKRSLVVMLVCEILFGYHRMNLGNSVMHRV